MQVPVIVLETEGITTYPLQATDISTTGKYVQIVAKKLNLIWFTFIVYLVRK